MKTKNLFYILGVSSIMFIGSLQAQVGTSENSMSISSSSNVDDQNEQRLFNLEEQLKDANAEVKREKQDVRTAKANAREAKEALRAEKQAQKARKQANDQARKAEKALN